MISMQQVLQLPIMNTALPLTSNADSSSITVYWASVIETPVEDFVRPRELILSSGIGCQNERDLLEFIEELMEAGASGVGLAALVIRCVAVRRFVEPGFCRFFTALRASADPPTGGWQAGMIGWAEQQWPQRMVCTG